MRCQDLTELLGVLSVLKAIMPSVVGSEREINYVAVLMVEQKMNDDFFINLLKILGTRRPSWTYVIEDTLIRVSTQYFAVDWEIIDEILQNKDYKVEQVLMHSLLGQVICIRYVAGS